MASKTFSAVCGRCLGSGRYDRGTCFSCNGARAVATCRPPVPRFEVSAVYSDGVRRLMRVQAAATAQAAVAKVVAARDWFGFDITTATGRALRPQEMKT